MCSGVLCRARWGMGVVGGPGGGGGGATLWKRTRGAWLPHRVTIPTIKRRPQMIPAPLWAWVSAKATHTHGMHGEAFLAGSIRAPLLVSKGPPVCNFLMPPSSLYFANPPPPKKKVFIRRVGGSVWLLQYLVVWWLAVLRSSAFVLLQPLVVVVVVVAPFLCPEEG